MTTWKEVIEQIRQSISETSTKRLIVRKKQPRRIVLEETGEGSHDAAFHNDAGMWTYWKIVEDNK